jgi:hypothetical protein
VPGCAARLVAALALSTVLAVPLGAQTVLVTFEETGLTGMSNAVGAQVPAGSRLSTQLLSSHGVKFDSNGGFVAVVVHGAATPSPPNIIGGTSAAGALSYLTPISVTFHDRANASLPAVTGWVRIRGDLSPLGSGSVTMQAFDLSGSLLGSVTDLDNKPAGSGPVLTLALPGIHRIVVSGTSGTVGFDDLEFEPTAVSYCEPGTSASGCRASIAASGTPSASAPSGFVLSATEVEGAKDGLLFFGTSGRQANPWGNGTSLQCVVPPVSRAGVLPGSGANGTCDGVFAQDLNAFWCAGCPKPGKNPGAGTLLQVQLWYRDPHSTSNQTTSLSNALEFMTGP